MADAQNERTNSSGRRRGRRAPQEPSGRAQPGERFEGHVEVTRSPAASESDRFVRPADIEPPAERMEVYCTHHKALLTEHEPMHIRTHMTTVRHLPVDHFGAATLFCDCLHNGSHEWPPTLQRIETAIELDQFINASNNDA